MEKWKYLQQMMLAGCLHVQDEIDPYQPVRNSYPLNQRSQYKIGYTKYNRRESRWISFECIGTGDNFMNRTPVAQALFFLITPLWAAEFIPSSWAVSLERQRTILSLPRPPAQSLALVKCLQVASAALEDKVCPTAVCPVAQRSKQCYCSLFLWVAGARGECPAEAVAQGKDEFTGEFRMSGM